jgi:hypothetical protein
MIPAHPQDSYEDRRVRVGRFALFTTFGKKFGPCFGVAGTGVGFVVGSRFATKCLAFSGEVLVLVLLGEFGGPAVPDIVDCRFGGGTCRTFLPCSFAP